MARFSRLEGLAGILRGLEQSFGMLPGCAVVSVGTKHAAELHDKLPLVELLDLCTRSSRPVLVLLDAEVARGKRRHLRQMGDAHDLSPRGEVFQLLPNRAGSVPADPGVDLVEDDRRRS